LTSKNIFFIYFQIFFEIDRRKITEYPTQQEAGTRHANAVTGPDEQLKYGLLFQS